MRVFPFIAAGLALLPALQAAERKPAFSSQVEQPAIQYRKEQREARASERVVIPFEFVNGLIWVQVEVPGARKPLQFVVDSGAGATVVEFGTARKLKLEFGEPKAVFGVGQNTVAYRIDTFHASVGGVLLNPEVYAVPLRVSKGEQKRRIDGMLGQDFFRNRVVEIDYARRVMVLHPHSVARKGASTLPIRYQEDAMCVPVALAGGKPEWVRLDTGCATALEWTGQSAGTVQWVKNRRAKSKVGETTVVLGGKTVGPVPVGFHDAPFFPGEAGLLGNGILGRFRVTIDAKAMKLLLE